MLDWLLGEVFGWAIALIGFALIWPIYKSGFLVRQGLVYQQSVTKINNMIQSSAAQSGAILRPTAEYEALKRKAVLLMVLPSLGLIALFVLLLVFTGWPLAIGVLALAVFGFVNVK
jgi:hypothetical protein